MSRWIKRNMETDKIVITVGAVLIIIVMLYIGYTKAEDGPGGQPPYPYNPAEEAQEELSGGEEVPPESEVVQFQCNPPEMGEYCNGNTRYYDFKCLEGNWAYRKEECAYSCSEGVCVNTGCPSCDDDDPCTVDLCSGGPQYECLHILSPGCIQETDGEKACVPTVTSGSSIKLEIYPTGASLSSAPEMSFVLMPGERVWLDSDDGILFEGFELEGSCPQCYEDPLLKWPPSAKIKVTKDLSGEDSSYYKEEGEVGYICLDGTCIDSTLGGCKEYSCNVSKRFVISELNAIFTCS